VRAQEPGADLIEILFTERREAELGRD